MAKLKDGVPVKYSGPGVCNEYEDRILCAIRACVRSSNPQKQQFLVSIEGVTYKAVVGRRKDRQITLHLIESQQVLPMFETTDNK